MAFFAKLHPLLVPFAVALLLTGVVFEFYGRLQHEESARTAGGFNLRMGLTFAVAAVIAGFLGVIGLGDLLTEADPRLSLPVKGQIREFLLYHMAFGFSTVVIFGSVLIVWRYRTRRWGPALYFCLLAVGLVTVLATGYFGGELVHRFGLPEPVQ